MDEAALAVGLEFLASHVPQIAAIVLCMAALAFSSLTEGALMRVEVGRARQLASEGRWGASGLLRLVEKRQEVLSTLVLLINLSIIVASAYTTELTIAYSGDSARWVPASSIGMIALLLVLCEVTPKTYAMRRPEAVGLAFAPMLGVVHTVVHPVGGLLLLIARFLLAHVVVPVIGGRVLPTGWIYSDEEMLELVAEGEAKGDIDEEEKDMIHGVIEFADKVVREVMRPRTDLVCVPAETTLAEAAEVGKESGYSRLPVYEESVDNVIGILYAKDMLSALQTDGAKLTAGQVARKPAPVVPESKNVDEVLRLMQRRRYHMAIVIDEYGGTAGLVTIEDLLEEIFGEIQDEYDYEQASVEVVDAETLVVDPRVSVDEIEDELHVKLPEGEFDSLGGFILDQLGRVPSAGESVIWQGWEFTAEVVSENRIQRVRVVRKAKEGEDAEGEQEGAGLG